jgi:hypothetical protein
MSTSIATRDVVSDLWPLYAAGEASDDTRALVEAFLGQDAEFAERLHDERTAELLRPGALEPPADHERATLLRTQRRRALQSVVVNALALLASAAMTAVCLWLVVPRYAVMFRLLGSAMPGDGTAIQQLRLSRDRLGRPDSPWLKRQALFSALVTGDAWRASGEHDRAKACYEEALRLARELAAAVGSAEAAQLDAAVRSALEGLANEQARRAGPPPA